MTLKHLLCDYYLKLLYKHKFIYVHALIIQKRGQSNSAEAKVSYFKVGDIPSTKTGLGFWRWKGAVPILVSYPAQGTRQQILERLNTD